MRRTIDTAEVIAWIATYKDQGDRAMETMEQIVEKLESSDEPDEEKLWHESKQYWMRLGFQTACQMLMDDLLSQERGDRLHEGALGRVKMPEIQDEGAAQEND